MKLEWWIGLVLSGIFGTVAYRLKLLTSSGFIAAIAVGTAIYGGTGWPGFLLLGFFFITSNGIGLGIKRIKFIRDSNVLNGSENNSNSNQTENNMVAKGSQRDAWQVVANGGVASLMVMLYVWTNDLIWMYAFASAIAAATSDTWSSEVGKLSRSAPRDIWSWRKKEPGTSGAITAVGTAAGLLAAALTAIVAILLFHSHLGEVTSAIISFFIITISGAFGNYMDTLIGALWQVRYKCLICGRITEKEQHCDKTTLQIKGVKAINNDMVNMICTKAAAISSILLYVILF